MNRFYLGSLLALLGCVLASATEVAFTSADNVSVASFKDEFILIKNVIFLPCLIVGALFTFFGLKLIKIIIFLSGFIPATGFSFTIILASNTASTGNPNSGAVFSAAAIAVIIGVIAGFVTLFCMKVAIFMVGFMCGFALIMILIGGLGKGDLASASGLGAIVGLFSGIAAIWIWEKAVIIITAFLGSSEMTFGIVCICENDLSLNTSRMMIYLIVGVAIFICGVLYQNKTKPKEQPKFNGVVFMQRPQPQQNVVVLNVNQNVQQTQNVNNVNNSVNSYNSVVNNNNNTNAHVNHVPHANPYASGNQQFIPPQQYQAPPMYGQQQPAGNHFAPAGGNYAPAGY